MQCPKCHFESDDQATECLRCGIVFAKYVHHQEAISPTAPQVQEQSPAEDVRQELKYRVLSLPMALVLARFGVATIPFLIRLLAMMVHETGHAVTAWLCGFWATPGIWFTPVSLDRSGWITISVIAILAGIAFRAWKTERPHLIVAGAAVLVVQLICTRLSYSQAQALIVFGG